MALSKTVNVSLKFYNLLKKAAKKEKLTLKAALDKTLKGVFSK